MRPSADNMKHKIGYTTDGEFLMPGCFIPLVFTTRGGMAQEATACLKRLASLLSECRNEPYCTVMGWLWCAISFCLLRSSLACIRGSLKRDRT